MKHAGKNQAGLFWETFFEDILKISLSLKRKISRMMHWIFVLWTVKTALCVDDLSACLSLDNK